MVPLLWHNRYWSTLVQAMACCLAAPSHHLKQCWHIISKGTDIPWAAISQHLHQPSITEIWFQIAYLWFPSVMSGANELINMQFHVSLETPVLMSVSYTRRLNKLTLILLNQNTLGQIGEYHDSWCPSFLYHQIISSHSIDSLRSISHCLPWRVNSSASTMFVLRND